MPSETVGRIPAPLVPWFPRGVTLLQNPELNKGTAFSGPVRKFCNHPALYSTWMC